jgi:hypothetical protein
MGQLVADIPNVLSLAPIKKLKKSVISAEENGVSVQRLALSRRFHAEVN